MSILIVGSGLSGSTIARKFADSFKKVTVIDQRNHMGGNVFDYEDGNTGIRVSKYGAHIFHTNDDEVWEFVNKYSRWTPYQHKVLSYVNDMYVPVPVNVDTVNKLFDLNMTVQEMEQWLDQVQYKGEIKNSEDAAKARVGDELYKLMFENYTIKQWDLTPAQLEPSVLERIPVRANYNDRYFQDKYEALPKHGYTAFIKKMLEHELIEVKLDTPYTEDMKDKYDLVIFTGKIDNYFNNKYGTLEYRSIYFEYDTLKVKDYQPTAVVNYPSLDYKFTRKIDYKQFYKMESDYSLIAREYSTSQGESYYPVPTPKNREIYKRYQSEAKKLEKENLYFMGRLAEYKYYNMDQAIRSALNLYERLK